MSTTTSCSSCWVKADRPGNYLCYLVSILAEREISSMPLRSMLKAWIRRKPSRGRLTFWKNSSSSTSSTLSTQTPMPMSSSTNTSQSKRGPSLFLNLQRLSSSTSSQKKAVSQLKSVVHLSSNWLMPSNSSMSEELPTGISSHKTFCSTRTLTSKCQISVSQHLVKAIIKTVSFIHLWAQMGTSHQKCKQESILACKQICSQPAWSYSLCTMAHHHSWAPSHMIRFTSWSEIETLLSFGNYMRRRNPKDFILIHSKDC